MGALSPTPPTHLVGEPGASLAASSDEWLARLAGRASERAFVALYHRYHDPLYRYVWSIARNEADAQDALQSTWTQVLVALRHGRRDAPVRPWLYRIAHNETINVLRRRGRDGEVRVQLRQPAPSAEESAIDREQLAQLVTDLQELAERPRSALLMRELSGLSHQEIAEALDITVGAAKQSILAARQGLADCAQGRATDCEVICRTISSADRRVLRGRRVRAHLKHCESCSTFAAAMRDRRTALRQLVPAVPPAASVSLLARVLKSAGGPSAGAGLTGGGA
ncbi:MAG: sigma-70 family RNA polymerase sigma factor, partial [Solirubrobacteraceae bacterium]